MNQQKLEQNLVELGVNDKSYTLNGVPYNDSSWVIEYVSKRNSVEKWSVFNFERGKRYDEKFFDSENNACIYILEMLKKQQETLCKNNLNHF